MYFVDFKGCQICVFSVFSLRLQCSMSLKGVNYVFYAIALLNSRIEKKVTLPINCSQYNEAKVIFKLHYNFYKEVLK